MRVVLLACVVAAGCTSVNGEFHCQSSAACVLDGRQGLCQLNGFCSFLDETCESQQRYGPHAGAYSGACVGWEPDVPDAMIDDDRPPENDHPAQASSLGGTRIVPFDLTSATVDTQSQCEPDSPDIFYTFTLFEEEVVYLDTLGSETSLEVWQALESCSLPTSLAERCATKTCGGSSGAGSGAQIADVFQAGTWCVKVSGEGTGVLSFVRGGRSGIPAARADSFQPFQSCEQLDLSQPSCTSIPDGELPEVAFFLASCGGLLSVSLEDGSNPAVIYLREGSADSDDLACQANVVSTFTGAGLYWVMVEPSPTCGSGVVTISWTGEPGGP